jgi:hypothetical protein
MVTARSLLLLAALLPFATQAAAHDHWINHGGFRSPITNEFCCGNNDCFEIQETQVKVNGVGYDLTVPRETIPYTEVLPSKDGKYWRCRRSDGTRRCFFAPPLSQ